LLAPDYCAQFYPQINQIDTLETSAYRGFILSKITDQRPQSSFFFLYSHADLFLAIICNAGTGAC